MKKQNLLLLLGIILLFSCGRKNIPAGTTTLPKSELEYVEKFKHISVKEMHRTGIPASITLAQGILESNYGKSRLAVQANNHFGIKCHGWQGAKIYHDDDEEQECFRKYKNAEESYIDHSEFLRNGRRYSFLFELKADDYKGWAHGLKKAGYATNPKYAHLLIDLIEKYRLHEYDHTPRKSREKEIDIEEDDLPEDKNIKENNRIRYIIARDGDTPISIAVRHNIPLRRLMRYNDWTSAELKAGDKVYLQPKRNKGLKKYHLVKGSETMHEISQIYGIKLDMLYKRNNMAPAMGEPAPGEKVWLRKYRPDTPALRPEELIEEYEEQPEKLPVRQQEEEYYIVQSGDTLYSIARGKGTTVEELKKLNSLTGSSISPGDKLRIK